MNDVKVSYEEIVEMRRMSKMIGDTRQYSTEKQNNKTQKGTQ